MKKIALIGMIAALWSTQTFAEALRPPVLTTDVSGEVVSLGWPKVESAMGYILEYAANPYQGEASIIREIKGDSTRYSFNLWPGASYYVAVKAYDVNHDKSAYSNIELVTVDPVQVVYFGLSRHRHGGQLLETGTFQVAVDLGNNLKIDSGQLIAPDNSFYGDFIVKGDQQIEIFYREHLASMEPFLIEGGYHFTFLQSDQSRTDTVFSIKKGDYPAFPKIEYPTNNTVGVSLNPSISFRAANPTSLAITHSETGEEVFFMRGENLFKENNGLKTIKIDTVTLEPNTVYLLEVNETDKSIAKGSTSAISFTTK